MPQIYSITSTSRVSVHRKEETSAMNWPSKRIESSAPTLRASVSPTSLEMTMKIADGS